MTTTAQRLMRHLAVTHTEGELIYAYGIAKAIKADKAQVIRILRRWAGKGWLVDIGLRSPDDGLYPPKRFYRITEDGSRAFFDEIIRPRED